MDINAKLNEAIEKQDWDLVKSITEELNKPKETPVKKKPGRPRKNPVSAPKGKKKIGRPPGTRNSRKGVTSTAEAKKQIKAKKEIVDIEARKRAERMNQPTYEYSPPAGTPGYKRENLFVDDMSLDKQDLGVVLTRDISQREVRGQSDYVEVTCGGCGFKTRVAPVVTVRGIEGGGAVRGYKCEKCLYKSD